MFESNSAAGRGLVLISDGENHAEDALASAREARKEGLAVYTVAVGSTQGSTIPLGRKGVKYDGLGQLVRTKANPVFLRELAAAGGGASYSAAEGRTAVQTLAQDLGQLQKAALQTKASTEYVPYFQWLLLPCLLLLIVEQILWWRKNKP